tara:strand:+ start:477 stop:743 length:267 start_codon:yes stop_codon:yes gene_type:complete
MITNFIGLLAGTCTTIAFIPQVVKVVKTKKTDGISLWMFIIFNIGILLWLLFGILTRTIVIILPNIIAFPLAIYILYYVIKNHNNGDK